MRNNDHYSPESTYYHSEYLCSDISFKTYTDARLAALFLENMDEFSRAIDLFNQILDVVTDPQFR